MNCTKVLYEELLPHEFKERIEAAPVAYLPLGTLEWHSFHLPFGADGIQSQGVMKQLAEKAGGIVLPMLFVGPDSEEEKDSNYYYGMDGYSFEKGHPQQLPGSAYHMPEEQFSQLLDRILENLARADFRAVIAHGHGPSTHLFRAKKEEYKKRFGLATYTLWDLGYEEEEGIQTDHAAANETALVMALRPDLVAIDRLPKEGISVSVWGQDPRVHASAERGKQLIAQNVELAAEKIAKLRKELSKPEIRMEFTKVANMLKE